MNADQERQDALDRLSASHPAFFADPFVALHKRYGWSKSEVGITSECTVTVERGGVSELPSVDLDDPGGFSGVRLRRYDGVIGTVIRSKESEPDGYGGFLYDLVIDFGGWGFYWHNIHASTIDDMWIVGALPTP